MKIQHDLHMHTSISPCGKENATPAAYVEIAKKNGLKTIGITNHLWDTAISPAINDFYEGQDGAHLLSESLPCEKGIRILRGCEAEMDKNGVIGLSPALAEKLDYVLVSHSHSQHDAVIPDSVRRDVKKLADVLCQRFSMLVENPLSKYITAIAHPFYPYGNPDNFDEVLFRISDDRLEDLFADAVYHNIALEINASAFASYPVESMHRSEMFRVYETAKDCGCKFTFGSDCHDIALYDDRLLRLSTLADLLEITEADLCPLVK